MSPDKQETFASVKETYQFSMKFFGPFFYREKP